jgi:lysophospholipase L1-like esterase
MVRNAILLVCSLVLACLLGEVAARFLFPEWAPRTPRITKFWQYHPRYGWAHVPNTSGRFSAYGFDTTVSINEKGFRGPNVRYERNAELKRVLILGDSLTWGFGVNYEDTFASRINQGSSQVELVNLAVSGYSTDQELLLYLDEGRKYEADTVVVVVAGNDVGGNMRTTAYFIYGKPAFRLHGDDLQLVNQPPGKVAWTKRMVVQVAWHSYVLTQMNRYLHKRKVNRILAVTEKRAPITSEEKTFPRSVAEKLSLRLLVELKRKTSEDKAGFLVVFATDVARADLAAEALRSFGIESIALRDYIDPNDKSQFLPDELHWSPAGHKTVADVLGEKLEEMLYREKR